MVTGGLFDMAVAAHRQGDLARARRLYRLHLEAEPRHARALANLGALLVQTGDARGGAKMIRQGLQIDPRQPPALNNLGNALLRLGRREEALAAYSRAVALRPDDPDALYNRGFALGELGRHPEALEALDAALAVRPAHPQALNRRGLALEALARPEEALAAFRQALALDPDDADAAANMGFVLLRLDRPAEALPWCEKVLALRADHAPAAKNRAVCLEVLGRLDEAVEAFRAAVALPDAEPATWKMLGSALHNSRRLEEALDAYDEALARDPGLADAATEKALSLLALGRYREGWALFERRWETPALAYQGASLRKRRLRDPQHVAGKRVLIQAEQGLGDTIHMLRYVPMLAARGARVTARVQPGLVALARTAPGIAAVIPTCAEPPPFDLQCPAMSLPAVFGTTLQTVPAPPYLSAEEAAAEAWRRRLGPAGKVRIGLAWSGSADNPTDRVRSLPAAGLAPLLACGAAFHSLQIEYRDADRDFIAADGRIADHAADLESFADTAALMEAMDLVISVDTSAAHLAGALGRPLWVLLSRHPDYRWGLEGESTPWYPGARLFRQRQRGDWDAVIARLAGELGRFLERP